MRVGDELDELEERRLCGYRVECRLYANVTVREAKELVDHLLVPTPPGMIEAVELTAEQYKRNLAMTLDVGRPVIKGSNQSNVTRRQLKAVSNALNALGLWSGKFHRHLDKITPQPIDL